MQMNTKTAEYLNALKAQKEKLAENLSAKGVECAKSELFNSLIKKVNTIYDTGGLAYGEWMPVEDSEVFTVTGLNAKPVAFGLSCERIITDYISREGNIYIALFNYEPDKEEVTFFKFLDDNTFVFDKVKSNLVYNVQTAEDGTYTATVSFTALNEMTEKPYLFKGGYEYNWVASSKEWFL